MNSKILVGLSTVVLALVAQAAAAGGRWDDGRGRGQEYARVVRVEPIIQRHRYEVPVRQCWQETGYRDTDVPARANATGAAIAGGVAGAILGSQIGSGDGRAVATAAGAAIGATLGHQAARNSGGYYVTPGRQVVERCRTVREARYDERVTAYRVTYEWRGRRQVTQMPYHPGNRIRVGVDVYPVR